MPGLGMHFALTPAQSRGLLDRAGDEERLLEFVHEDIEQACEAEWSEATDKAWDAMHRCLAGGTFLVDPSNPLIRCVAGGLQLHEGEDSIVSFADVAQVIETAGELESIDRAALCLRYDAIDPEEYGCTKSDEDFEYTWEYFGPVRDLFRRAALAGRAIVFSADD